MCVCVCVLEGKAMEGREGTAVTADVSGTKNPFTAALLLVLASSNIVVLPEFFFSTQRQPNRRGKVYPVGS